MSPAIDYSNPEVKEYLSKIGEIVVRLSGLEHQIEFWIWKLIDARGDHVTRQRVGSRTTTYITYEQKVQLLRGLILERCGEDTGRQFMPLREKLIKCCEDRNDVAHSQWLIR